MTTQSLMHVERDDRPPPIPSQTDVVVDGIRSVIIRGQLGPGARLPGRRTLPWSSTSLDGNPALQAIARGDPDAARIWMGPHLLAVQEFSRDHLRVARMKPLAVLDHQPPPVPG
jgi:DNA-binding GntR family transcriptional regulator